VTTALPGTRRPAPRFDLPPRATLGCVQLPTDLTLDQEGPALVERVAGVRLRLQKLELDGERLDLANYESARGRIQRAAATLRPRGSLDAVGLACTSLAFSLGEQDVRAELSGAHPGAAVTDMATAMIAGLHALGASRAALLTPYLDELHARNLSLLERRGVEVVADRNLGLETDAEITSVSPHSLAELIQALDIRAAEVVVVGCSAFRACAPGYLDALEELLGKPVLTSQQAFLWHLLRIAGVSESVAGYGALLRLPGPASRPT